MKRKWSAFIPWIFLGSIAFYSLMWYGSSLSLKNEINDVGEQLNTKGFSFKATSSYLGGYPLKFRHFFHNVRLRWKDEVLISIPSLSIESDILFPFKKKLQIHFDNTVKVLLEKKGYTLRISDLKSTFYLSPVSVEIQADSMKILEGKDNFADLQKSTLFLLPQSVDSMKADFQGHLQLYFQNIITPTVHIDMNLQCFMDHWKNFLGLQESTKKTLLPFNLSLDIFEFKTAGSLFKGTGSLSKKPQDSWEGILDLKLQGLSDFVDLVEDFFQKSKSPLLKILYQLPDLFGTNQSGEITLPLRLKQDRLSIRGLPFFSISLK